MGWWGDAKGMARGPAGTWQPSMLHVPVPSLCMAERNPGKSFTLGEEEERGKKREKNGEKSETLFT